VEFPSEDLINKWKDAKGVVCNNYLECRITTVYFVDRDTRGRSDYVYYNPFEPKPMVDLALERLGRLSNFPAMFLARDQCVCEGMFPSKLFDLIDETRTDMFVWHWPLRRPDSIACIGFKTHFHVQAGPGGIRDGIGSHWVDHKGDACRADGVRPVRLPVLLNADD
jgi:hypothetical protein